MLQIPLFLIFLTIYLFALVGNCTIIIIIIKHPHLQTPMYFFIGNLGILDIFYISTTVPKMLVNFLRARKSISFVGCVLQLYFYLVMAATESTLLSTMAYDRFVAICKPLRYLAIMNQKFCLQLATYSWIIGFIYSAIHTFHTFQLNFCRSNIIDHFYCDIPPLLKISCSDTITSEIVVYVVGGLLVLICFPLIIVSYVFIIQNILRIPSARGRSKTFSTCISHLLSVSLFYVSGSFAYFRPMSLNAMAQYKINAVFYTIIPPMINPLIYSLRNKELKKALRKVLQQQQQQ
ncbi:olfactory receptor 5I1-like [Spea bombifrons]|uniref:olfactory receptor 5I1-like n=1 Tax=Spea bombifrons TaxID=233779 RepID=UPI00234B775B|nr:olfactory receptor 5I1-like [Spea bombifrons]